MLFAEVLGSGVVGTLPILQGVQHEPRMGVCQRASFYYFWTYRAVLARRDATRRTRYWWRLGRSARPRSRLTFPEHLEGQMTFP